MSFYQYQALKSYFTAFLTKSMYELFNNYKLKKKHKLCVSTQTPKKQTLTIVS